MPGSDPGGAGPCPERVGRTAAADDRGCVADASGLTDPGAAGGAHDNGRRHGEAPRPGGRTGGGGSGVRGSIQPGRLDPGTDVPRRARPFFRQAGQADGARPTLAKRRRRGWQGAGYEFAAAADELIALGHRGAEVMDYTPRQVESWLFIARRRRDRDVADDLQMHALAAQGSAKQINDKAKRLRGE